MSPAPKYGKILENDCISLNFVVWARIRAKHDLQKINNMQESIFKCNSSNFLYIKCEEDKECEQKSLVDSSVNESKIKRKS